MMDRKGCTFHLEMATIIKTTATTNAMIKGIPVMLLSSFFLGVMHNYMHVHAINIGILPHPAERINNILNKITEKRRFS